jgi:hypothetical protein
MDGHLPKFLNLIQQEDCTLLEKFDEMTSAKSDDQMSHVHPIVLSHCTVWKKQICFISYGYSTSYLALSHMYESRYTFCRVFEAWGN